MRDALHDAFVEDHRYLTRGLAALRDALRGGASERIGLLANQLDRQAGPHIEFEETSFYPALEPLLGTAAVDLHYGEHAMGRRALIDLSEIPPGKELSPAEREGLASKIDASLKDALSCGTLLNHLDGMDRERRSALLEELQRCRVRQHRWTELPAHESNTEREPGRS